MKLLSCHIENYGTLHDYTCTFHDGINTIYEDNGWGKSTLASFIRVMFFGFNAEGKRSELENERRRYSPWQKGTYGGQLTFEVDHKTYRIVRIFSTKKAADDEFTLYDAATNLLSHDYSGNIGEELFSLDAESFQRTVFISQQDCTTEVTAKINAKIGNVEEETADMGNYEAVADTLKKELSRLEPDRRTGLINKNNAQLSQLREQIRNKDDLQAQFDQLTNRITSLHEADRSIREQTKKVQDQLNQLSSLNDLKVLYEKYTSIQTSYTKAKTAYTAARQAFPLEVPPVQKVDEAITAANQLNVIQQSITATSLNDTEENTYHSLARTFQHGMPSDADISDTAQKIHILKDLNDHASSEKLSSAEQSQYERCRTKFGANPPSEEEISRLKQEWDSTSSAQSSLSAKQLSADMYQQNMQSHSSSLDAKIYLIVGVILCAACILLFFVMKNIIPVIAGIAVLAIAVILYFTANQKQKEQKNTKTKAQQSYQDILNDIQATKDQITNTQHQVQTFLTSINGHYDSSSAGSDLVRLIDEVRLYQQLQQRISAYQAQSYTMQKDTIEKEIQSFLHLYHMDTSKDCSTALQQLIYDQKEYRHYNERIQETQKAKQNYTSTSNALTAFFKQYGISTSNAPIQTLNNIRAKCIELNTLYENCTQAEAELNTFTHAHDIHAFDALQKTQDSATMEELNTQFDALQHKQEEITYQFNSYQKQRDDLSEVLDQTETDEQLYQQLNETNQHLLHRYNVIHAAKDLLDQARTQFSAHYMDPIKNAFDRYYSILAGDDQEYELDANLNLTLKAYGKNRSTSLMSEGYKDLVGLCRRMAMIDAMYEAERPFILADDPFVNLDDQKLAGAKHFLETIAHNYQIIYFTCTKTREIPQ